MKTPRPITVDFETDAIQKRPHYPPKPVGVSIKKPGKAPKYYAWGHPCENNCTKEDAGRALAEAWAPGGAVLFHNGKFDVDVAEVHFGLPRRLWDFYHDTLFLLFLHNPHAKELSLKPSSEAILGMPPEERDAVRDWVLANVSDIKPSEWGAHISKAPGKLVGTYANGDTDRTERLFVEVWPRIQDAGMGAAYDRERRLMPILLDNERVGLRVDAAALRADLAVWRKLVEKCERWLCEKLGVSFGFNFDSDEEKATALEKSGIVTQWKLTPTGRRSTAKGNMTPDMFNDPKVASVLGYRDRLCTCIRMFAENWLAEAEAGDGHIHTNWNQVRQGDGNNKTGTRTSRPSTSNPNLLNLSKTWDDKDDGYVHPKFLRIPELPLMRCYILPDVGGVFGHRDYNQQELRTVAHFEGGALLELYNRPVSELPQEFVRDGKLDIHSYASHEILRIRGVEISRRPTKITVFRKIYGGGVPATATALKCSAEEAKRIISAVEHVLPGLKDLEREVKNVGKRGEAIITWGGRLYYVEPPSFSKKYSRNMTYEYKLLNYLIQGSAADITKEAIIRFVGLKKDSRFLVTVYDECNISVPAKALKREMGFLKQAMESIELDVPMLTDAKTGPNWGSLEKYT